MALAWDAPVAEQNIRIHRVFNGLLPPVVARNQPLPRWSLAERMQHYRTPGVSVAVLRNGEVAWARGVGVLVEGKPGAVTEETLFQAASISKPVAAAAALVLVQQGKLRLDEDVNRRLVSWKIPPDKMSRGRPVTLRQLLSHSAGLSVHGFPGYRADIPTPNLKQVLDGLDPANTRPVRLEGEPGKRWQYSGGGYCVLQQLIADVSGEAFEDFVRKTVLLPAGMRNSGFEQPLAAHLRSSAACGHTAEGELVAGCAHTYPEMAAAGLWTTASDLAKFAGELSRAASGRSSRILTPAMAKEMMAVQAGQFGLGIQVHHTPTEIRFSHGGANAGYRSELMAYVHRGDGVVVMTNSDQGNELAMEVVRSAAVEYGWPGLGPVRVRTTRRTSPD